jgi:uncharacterized membrane protein (DUF4010 family)
MPGQLPNALTGLAEALLIGLIVGAQREAAQHERQAGVRDFLLIALTGGICGALQNAWLTVAALLAIAMLLAVFHWRAGERTGITTEMAAVATFCLAFLASTPGQPFGALLAVGGAVVVVAFLEAKRSLHKFIRETMTETEFDDTIRFLAIIFIIYPILPRGEYGPYGFFVPRTIWLFVILISSISYVGYFLQKFLGVRKGLGWTAVLGGLASTTAATVAFARDTAKEPAEQGNYWHASVIANAIQFPRVLVVLYVVNANLARASLGILLAMTAAGLLFGMLLLRRGKQETASRPVPLGNPFRLLPALKFGALFAIILFLSKAAAAEVGGDAIYWASAVGGAVDVDAIAVSLAGLLAGGSISAGAALAALLLALLMNAVVKSLLAAYAGSVQFGCRVASGFGVMFGVGGLAWALVRS